AGAYVFGRKDRGPGSVARGPDWGARNRYRATAWRILLRGQMPAYITWERYEANQTRLRGNLSITSSPGASRGGPARLAGLAVCGTCGRRLNTQYPSGGRGYYLCTRHLQNVADRTCHGVAARAVDRVVAAQVFEALKPAALEVSLRAIEDERRERERLGGHPHQELGRARDPADRGGRADHPRRAGERAGGPAPRRAGGTVERRWEEALLQLRRVEEEFDRFTRGRPARLTDEERARIVSLAADIPALWDAPGTTHADRKDIIRCLVERVVIRVQGNTERCEVEIGWKGGHVTRHAVRRPVQSQRQLRDEGR